MDKKAVDFQVKIALDQTESHLCEMGVEYDQEFVNDCREIIEGMTIRELAQCEEKPRLSSALRA